MISGTLQQHFILHTKVDFLFIKFIIKWCHLAKVDVAFSECLVKFRKMCSATSLDKLLKIDSSNVSKDKDRGCHVLLELQ